MVLKVSFDVIFRPQKVGELVVGRFSEDNGLYRAVVLSLSDTTAKLCYIDYGNEEERPFSAISMATQHCCSVPAQSLKCCLAGVTEPANQKWPETAHKDFIRRISKGTKQMLEAEYKKTCGDIVVLDIKDCDTGESLSDVLNKQMAPQGAIPKQLPTPAATPTNVVTVEKVPQVKLPSGQKVKVGVTHINSFDSFYVQLLDESNQESLGQVTQSLAHICGRDNTSYAPVCGELVCAQFSDDKLWYRAEVKHTDSSDCNVLYIDYGNHEDKVPWQRVRIIDPSLASIPRQGIHCCLAGVNNSSPESLLEFKSSAGNVMMDVQVQEYSNNKHWVVMHNIQNVNINEYFGATGHVNNAGDASSQHSVTQNTNRSENVNTSNKKRKRMSDMALTRSSDNGPTGVVITHTESPGEFYCQLTDQKCTCRVN